MSRDAFLRTTKLNQYICMCADGLKISEKLTVVILNCVNFLLTSMKLLTVSENPS